MKARKSALITGISGQDGSYLSEYLLSKDYEVHGLIRKASHFTTERIEHLFDTSLQIDSENFHLHYGDLQDQARLFELISQIKPDEIYNLAAQSHVKVSFEMPYATSCVDALGVIGLLECVRILQLRTRIYQASSSEMFGDQPAPQSERTPLAPRSPYAASKVFGHNVVKIYRESYGMFVVSGILFNHESPRRHESFVTRKISKAAAEIKLGRRSILELGNLDARRDWGFAPEYVEAMWLMLQQSNPSDFVIATGSTYSIRDFLNFSFNEIGLDWQDHIKINQKYFRPMEVPNLLGDATFAKKELGWEAKTFAPELASIMVEADLTRLKG